VACILSIKRNLVNTVFESFLYYMQKNCHLQTACCNVGSYVDRIANCLQALHLSRVDNQQSVSAQPCQDCCFDTVLCSKALACNLIKPIHLGRLAGQAGWLRFGGPECLLTLTTHILPLNTLPQAAGVLQSDQALLAIFSERLHSRCQHSSALGGQSLCCTKP